MTNKMENRGEKIEGMGEKVIDYPKGMPKEVWGREKRCWKGLVAFIS